MALNTVAASGPFDREGSAVLPAVRFALPSASGAVALVLLMWDLRSSNLFESAMARHQLTPSLFAAAETGARLQEPSARPVWVACRSRPRHSWNLLWPNREYVRR